MLRANYKYFDHYRQRRKYFFARQSEVAQADIALGSCLDIHQREYTATVFRSNVVCRDALLIVERSIQGGRRSRQFRARRRVPECHPIDRQCPHQGTRIQTRPAALRAP